MKIGKLNHEELQELVLDRLPKLAGNVASGPAVGLDCAAVRFGDGQVVLTCDPITGAAAEIGRLAVHVACNDIAACGIRPSILMMVIIAPPSCTAGDIRQVVDQAAKTAEKLNVSIVGGHTEVSDAVSRFVISTTALGFTYGAAIIQASGGQPGDSLLMTKSAGLEGSAVFAADQRDRLLRFLSAAEVDQAAAMIDSISVVNEGACGGDCNVHAMHDATEGGILGASWELAESSGLGCVILADTIPVHPLTARICAALAVDPLRLISSGSLIIATDQPDKLIQELDTKGIVCTRIGFLTKETARFLETDGKRIPLDPPGPDELYKIQ